MVQFSFGTKRTDVSLPVHWASFYFTFSIHFTLSTSLDLIRREVLFDCDIFQFQLLFEYLFRYLQMWTEQYQGAQKHTVLYFL